MTPEEESKLVERMCEMARLNKGSIYTEMYAALTVVKPKLTQAHAEGYAKGLEDAARVAEAAYEYNDDGEIISADHGKTIAKVIRALTQAPHNKNLEPDDIENPDNGC